jgi:hypothetical protein
MKVETNDGSVSELMFFGLRFISFHDSLVVPAWLLVPLSSMDFAGSVALDYISLFWSEERTGGHFDKVFIISCALARFITSAVCNIRYCA